MLQSTPIDKETKTPQIQTINVNIFSRDKTNNQSLDSFASYWQYALSDVREFGAK